MLETAALVGLIIKNCVDVLKDINSASEESKSLWVKVKGLFVVEDENINDLEKKPTDKDTQEVVAATLKKELNKLENEQIKLELAAIISKIQPAQGGQGNVNILGNKNIVVHGSSGVTINK